MTNSTEETKSLRIAERWCEGKGDGWSVSKVLGKGGTAPVFEVNSPDGIRALKIYDSKFSTGRKGQIEEKRIAQQLTLIGHDCPHLVEIYEGGRHENRLYLLMSRAPGKELEKRLNDVPREKIRLIIDQVARAAIYLKEKGLCHRDIKAANIFISDDFDHCTLLDISVVRDVLDPIGIGTDHEGQLPIVATARYSPPEYLFRLLDPSPELWHSLNVYQLGALLHDLVMRQPLFEKEFLESSENRYRFAWTIANTEPQLQAEDVDKDLLFLARRSLDKDWTRRVGVAVEEFLADNDVRQTHALQVLGVGIASKANPQTEMAPIRLQRIVALSDDLKHRVVQFFTDESVRAMSVVRPGPNDTTKIIAFTWDAPSDSHDHQSQKITFEIAIQLLNKAHGLYIGLSATLTIPFTGKTVSKKIELPEIPDGAGAESMVYQQTIDAFRWLAVQITSVDAIQVEV